MTGVPPVVLPPLEPPVEPEPEPEPEFVLVPPATEAEARPLWMVLGPDLLALVPLVLLPLVLPVLVLLVLVLLVRVLPVPVPLDPALRAVPALEREPPWRVWCSALPSTTELLPLVVYEGRPTVLLLPPNCALPMPMPTTAAVAPVASMDSPAMPASDRCAPRRVCPSIFST